jgi:hypothetical protein
MDDQCNDGTDWPVGCRACATRPRMVLHDHGGERLPPGRKGKTHRSPRHPYAQPAAVLGMSGRPAVRAAANPSTRGGTIGLTRVWDDLRCSYLGSFCIRRRVPGHSCRDR